MIKFRKIFEVIFVLQTIIFSNMLPTFITIPNSISIYKIYDIPCTWHIPFIILLTLLFSEKTITASYLIYIFIGLFILPVFYDGGSLGYVLTPNFGYIIGVFPLIRIIKTIKNEKNITFLIYFKKAFTALTSLHLVGITYLVLQLLIYNKSELIFYNIGKYSLSKIFLDIVMLCPIFILIKISRKLRINYS